jgi:hypothetical protein
MKLIYFFFFLIICSSFTYGFDCSYFDDQTDCLALQEVNESLIANLIYENSLTHDFDLIRNYNDDIVVNEPVSGTNKVNNNYIKNAWFNMLSVEPTILFNDTLYYKNRFFVRTAYDYDIHIPSTYTNDRKRIGQTCKIKYYLYSQDEEYSLYVNNNFYTHNENQVVVTNGAILDINPKLKITITIKEKIYEWTRRGGRWRCEYDRSRYSSNTITLDDYKQVKRYTSFEEPDFELLHNYNNMHYGNLSNYTGNLILNFEDSKLTQSNLEFKARFISPPHYFLQLEAVNKSEVETRNIYHYNDLLAIPNNEDCSLEYTDLFNTHTKECSENYQELELEEFEIKEYSANWTLLLYLIVFVAVNYGIFILFRRYFRVGNT